MAVKAPEADQVTEVPSMPEGEGWADLFVNLKDLDVQKKATTANPLLDLLGVPLVLLSVRSEDGKKGDMDVVKREDVTADQSGISYDQANVMTMAVPRGGMRVLAAAAGKANGRNIVITPFKKAKGIGFE